MRLDGKTAIVTGAASGFGSGIATCMAEAGAKIFIADVNEDDGNEVASQIASQDGWAKAVRCDVTSSDDWAAVTKQATEETGRLDIVVNNAGAPQINQDLLSVDEETFDLIFEVNVKSIYLSAVHTVPVMRKAGGGSIINTASTAAIRPRPGLTWYNGSKGAVVTLTKSMAVELAPDNIRVNALCPVAGETPMLGAFMGGEVTNEMTEKFISTIPLGRLSTPQDMGNVALFLATDEASFLTGVCIEVDGGRCV